MTNFFNMFTELPFNLIFPIGLAVALYFTFKMSFADKSEEDDEKEDNKMKK